MKRQYIKLIEDTFLVFSLMSFSIKELRSELRIRVRNSTLTHSYRLLYSLLQSDLRALLENGSNDNATIDISIPRTNLSFSALSILIFAPH